VGLQYARQDLNLQPLAPEAQSGDCRNPWKSAISIDLMSRPRYLQVLASSTQKLRGNVVLMDSALYHSTQEKREGAYIKVASVAG
jgi:hypothetical protein